MIIIPMAGLSSRFLSDGYHLPKYMLQAAGISLFQHSLLSFRKYFLCEEFIFIINKKHNALSFVEKEISDIGIRQFKIIELQHDTRGQADTVNLALRKLKYNNDYHLKKPMSVFNIDTKRSNLSILNFGSLSAGYLEVFTGAGDNWSFVKPKTPICSEVERTAEKERISTLCSTGFYHFSEVGQFLLAFSREEKTSPRKLANGELYVAPLYNQLINSGCTVHYHKINQNDIDCFGTPIEYKNFCDRIDQVDK